MTSFGRCLDIESALPADASTLKVVEHSLSAVASLPRRLANPPPRQSKLELQDVLAGRHCSPIALTDFEYYLTYTEHSVENLYFTLWLQAYKAEHDGATLSDPTIAAHASDSVSIAARTYIRQNAPYEINLSEQKRNDILALPTSPPPQPSVYTDVQTEVKCVLEESMHRWEKYAKSNAGWRRLAFSTYVGFFNACLTVVAMVIVRIHAPGKIGRIVAGCLTPWLWFAIVGVICGLKGVCFLCYSVGGTVRQVSSFELALPRTSGTSAQTVSKREHFGSVTQESISDKQDDPFSAPAGRGAEVVVRPTETLRNRRSIAQSKTMLVKLWAPMVEVKDPLIVRAHWEAVIYGFFWSAVLAIPAGVIAAAV